MTVKKIITQIKQGTGEEDKDTSPIRSNQKDGQGTEPLSAYREMIRDSSEGIRGMISSLIPPKERTLKNYTSLAFWNEKRKKYSRQREKEKQDLDLFNVLSRGAYPSIEYYILIILSCLIATAGLIQGSTATIIGAMIVAPLMTPILAFSLGVIWGDIDVIRTAVLSIMKGVLIAVLISSAFSYVVPIPDYSPEILSRTRPSLFDIIVALASGIVGAYGNANRRISGTLVGIAIAVALMPPLCTVGIGIGTANLDIARGAILLFLINLISISLAGAVVFWLMKLHPISEDRQEVARRALSQIAVSIIMLAFISIPVIYYMKEGYASATTQEMIIRLVSTRHPGISVMSMQVTRGSEGLNVSLTVTGPSAPDVKDMAELKKEIEEEAPFLEGISIQYIQALTI